MELLYWEWQVMRKRFKIDKRQVYWKKRIRNKKKKIKSYYGRNLWIWINNQLKKSQMKSYNSLLMIINRRNWMLILKKLKIYCIMRKLIRDNYGIWKINCLNWNMFQRLWVFKRIEKNLLRLYLLCLICLGFVLSIV